MPQPVQGKTNDSDSAAGDFVNVDGTTYYRIANSHQMPEFFMSLTSSSDHWMFVSSRGALTAGRKTPDSALFPYYSADKISDMVGVTGPKTIIRLKVDGRLVCWEPFASKAPSQNCSQNAYKTALGNKLILEEVNHELMLRFNYQWSFSHDFGFVRQCCLANLGEDRELEILDGVQNVLPGATNQDFVLRFSNLADAYKKSELVAGTRLALYYLSSVPTDRAEPSEGLLATTIWQVGMDKPTVLLSTKQLDDFRNGKELKSENDVRGLRGCYLVHSSVQLKSGELKDWSQIANINQDQAEVHNLNHMLASKDLFPHVVASVEDNASRLESIVAATDGVQVSQHPMRTSRHLANTLFNVMRGGYPAFGYDIPQEDLQSHVEKLNRSVADRNQAFLNSLPTRIQRDELIEKLDQHGDAELLRIGIEYLPLTFGRRHGDPTRPWNTFSISTLDKNGDPQLDYQGNWRDIFQNWEALAVSFPQLTSGFIFRFVNASTLDGYNPYRVTKEGFEWEAPDPDDPWANIGYWGDHQIIYLLKLLEWSRRFAPEKLDQWLNKKVCTYANVPYRIADFGKILTDPQDTIEYDFELEREIEERVQANGNDGKLVQSADGKAVQVGLGEKLLLTTLTKLSNFVPDGGIWLNTQRPEWNDANNALVGRGLSMVTVYYLRRHLSFLKNWFETTDVEALEVTEEVATFFDAIGNVFKGHAPASDSNARKEIVFKLSQAGCDYRRLVYTDGLKGERRSISVGDCVAFFQAALAHVDQTIQTNERDDGLYHSYNLIAFDKDESGQVVGVNVEYLPEMLEGQVAVLSANYLTAERACSVLNSLRNSAMYRADQNSYMLYPDRTLPTFLEKNTLASDFVSQSKLVQKLIEAGDASVVKQDIQGAVHFQGDIRNSECLKTCLEDLPSEFQNLVAEYGNELVEHFVAIFDHSRFTGRSGTFFAYEGLGSIYWHMVSKLLLAATENFWWAVEKGASQSTLDTLAQHCSEIRDGIAVEKSPEVYGAFPTDPYSHTPKQAGAQQPGMTGQVKEDLLARFLELGVHFNAGQVRFDSQLLDQKEYLESEISFGKAHIPEGCLGFTLCGVQVLYRKSDSDQLIVKLQSGEETVRTETRLTKEECIALFRRDQTIQQIEVSFSS